MPPKHAKSRPNPSMGTKEFKDALWGWHDKHLHTPFLHWMGPKYMLNKSSRHVTPATMVTMAPMIETLIDHGASNATIASTQFQSAFTQYLGEKAKVPDDDKTLAHDFTEHLMSCLTVLRDYILEDIKIQQGEAERDKYPKTGAFRKKIHAAQHAVVKN